MQSGNVQTAAVGLFAQLLNAGVVEEGGLDAGAPSDFIDAMGKQIRGLLEKNGMDSAALESADNQALVTAFLSAMQGQAAGIQVDPDGGGSSALEGLNRLLSGLDRGQPEGAQAAAENHEAAGLAGVDGLERIEALPAFVLEQLAQSGALGGGAQGYGQALSASPGQLAVDAVGTGSETQQPANSSARSALEARLAELLSSLGQVGAASNVGERSGTSGQGLATALYSRLVSPSSPNAAGASAAEADVGGMSDRELAEFVEALRSQLAAGATEQVAGSTTKGAAVSAVQSLAQALGAEQGGQATSDSIAALIGRSFTRSDALAARSMDETAEDAAGLVTGLKGGDASAGLQRAQVFDLSKLLQPGGEGRLAEQVKWTMQAGLESAELKLHPPSLGTLDVRVTMEGDKASVQFVSPHPVVREVLEAALPRLREALAQDGVALVDVSVSEHRAGGGDGSAGSDSGQRDEAQGLDAAADEVGDELGTAVGALSRRLSQHDYFA